MMKGLVQEVTDITNCYMGPQISPEQFVPEHVFLYLANGHIEGYDGYAKHTLQRGECCLVRKNQLARYTKRTDDYKFGKVVVVFDEAFLKRMAQKHDLMVYRRQMVPPSAFIPLHNKKLIPAFIQSLLPYYQSGGVIEEQFADVKREELLLILLRENQQLSSVLFDFGAQQKLDLEAYMNRNYKFNVSVARFAQLTGRSLSSFKRDFEAIFSETPSRWLISRRLEEAYFLITLQGRRPTDIYLELGFEDISHFSYAFKKKFGTTAAALLKDK